MKKLIALLGTITLTTTAVAGVVACKNVATDETDVIVKETDIEAIKKELTAFSNKALEVKKESITKTALITELSRKLDLGDAKIEILDDTSFTQPKIDLIKNEPVSNEGTATVVVKYNDEEQFRVDIKWITVDIKSYEKINNILSIHKDTARFDLGFKISTFDSTLGKLVTLLPIISGLLPKTEIEAIDLTKPFDDTFKTQWNKVLSVLNESTLKLGLDLIDMPVNFFIAGTIDGQGKLGQLLTNIAPDIVALLQWLLKEGSEKINSQKNVLLALVQYLFSDMSDKNINGGKNINIKNHAVTTFGDTDHIVVNRFTNLDSLLFNLLTGYDGIPKYKINVQVLPGVNMPADKDLIKDFLGLVPSHLFANLINGIITNKAKIGIFDDNIIKLQKGIGGAGLITDLLASELSNVNLGPLLIQKYNKEILVNFGISEADLNNSNLQITGAMWKIMIKDNTDQWVPLDQAMLTMTGGKATVNFKQLLEAKDIKIAFTEVIMKLTLHKEKQITKEFNNLAFDLVTSNNI